MKRGTLKGKLSLLIVLIVLIFFMKPPPFLAGLFCQLCFGLTMKAVCTLKCIPGQMYNDAFATKQHPVQSTAGDRATSLF